MATRVICSLVGNAIKGHIPRDQLASRFNDFEFGKAMTPGEAKTMKETGGLAEWHAIRNIDYETLGLRKDVPWYSNPGLYEILTVVVMIAMMIWLW